MRAPLFDAMALFALTVERCDSVCDEHSAAAVESAFHQTGAFAVVLKALIFSFLLMTVRNAEGSVQRCRFKACNLAWRRSQLFHFP